MEAKGNVGLKKINAADHMQENMDIFWFISSTNISEN